MNSFASQRQHPIGEFSLPNLQIGPNPDFHLFLEIPLFMISNKFSFDSLNHHRESGIAAISQHRDDETRQGDF